MSRSSLTFVICFLCCSFFCTTSLLAKSPGDVLVSVNGRKITEGDLAFFMLSRNVPVERQAEMRKRTLNILVERKLMSDFLAKRKVKVSSKEINRQVRRIHKLIRKQKKDPFEVLSKMGFTPARLKEELQLPLAWGIQARRIITDEQLRKYYKKHQSQFDGSKVHAQHIFIKMSRDTKEDKLQQATQKLLGIKKTIDAGETTFAEAAKTHSESPSKKEGGDVGLISYRGAMPAAFCAAAFKLKQNEVSQPIRTPFGLHLITVTEIKKGDISLEDARAIVFNQLAGEIWDGLVKQQKAKATIKWHDK